MSYEELQMKMTEIIKYPYLKEDIETVLNYIGTNIILNYARQDDTYSLNNKERIAYMRLSKCVGKGYEQVDLNKEFKND